MTYSPSSASPQPAVRAEAPEITAIDTHARGPVLLLVGSGVMWLVISGIFALIASIQLHSPAFLADHEWFTHGRAVALRETAFIYGWAANAGLGIALWVLGRLGGYPLRGLNWTIAGTLFWNLGVIAGLVGIAIGDLTTYAYLQMPRYVQPLLAFAYAAIAIPGVLAWWGRRSEGTFASQWYAVAALFLFPWMLTAAQIVLLWSPVRGVVQPIAASWFAQGAWTLWLAPLALAGAYYVIPKITGRVLPTYDTAPLAFWTLIFAGAWTGGRHLIGGPVPAWIPTMAVAAASLLAFHYLVIALNFRPAFGAPGNAAKFLRFGLIAYVLLGAIEAITSFRGVAVETQFTFLTSAFEMLGVYGGISMMFFGAIYYMVPRLAGVPWASTGFLAGHRVLVMFGIVVGVLALAVAGWTQGTDLLTPEIAMADIFNRVRLSLMMSTFAQMVLLGANLLLLVNFCRTVTAPSDEARATNLFRPTSTMGASAS